MSSYAWDVNHFGERQQERADPYELKKRYGVRPPALPGFWQIVFQDEFPGSALDLTKWEPSWFAGSSLSPPVNGSSDN